MNVCEQWYSRQTVNPRTNRKIKVNGPTFQKLVKECQDVIDAQKPTTKPNVVKYFLNLFNDRVFDGLFTDLLVVKFTTQDLYSNFVVKGDKIIIYLSKSINVNSIKDVLLHEMCLVASQFTDGPSWTKWILKASTQLDVKDIKLPTKCYDYVTSKCDPCGNGIPLTFGDGDCGQLGLGPDVFEKSRPTKLFKEKLVFVQAEAGGLHTASVTTTGQVYTFGCNDEHALGRLTPDECSSSVPKLVKDLVNIVQVSCGDSHTAALDSFGKVFVWGTFRNSNGPIATVSTKPLKLKGLDNVVKIASGTDHLVLLNSTGLVYTMGDGEQGQLGRNLVDILEPGLVVFPAKSTKIVNIWTGQYGTYAKSTTGKIFAWGLNNYHQLGFSDTNSRYFPQHSKLFDKRDWQCISGGQHHVLCLTVEGYVYALGRSDYGRLGIGTNDDTAKSLTLIDANCVDISAGTASSYSVDNDGVLYSWGIAGNQLGQGPSDKDIFVPTRVEGAQLVNRKCVSVSAGGQHAVVLVCDI